jgi:hypothetical protein
MYLIAHIAETLGVKSPNEGNTRGRECWGEGKENSSEHPKVGNEWITVLICLYKTVH